MNPGLAQLLLKQSMGSYQPRQFSPVDTNGIQRQQLEDLNSGNVSAAPPMPSGGLNLPMPGANSSPAPIQRQMYDVPELPPDTGPNYQMATPMAQQPMPKLNQNPLPSFGISNSLKSAGENIIKAAKPREDLLNDERVRMGSYQADIIADQKKQKEEYDAALKDSESRVKSAFDAINAHNNSEDSKSSFGTVLDALGASLGAIGASLSSSPNFALQMIIERNRLAAEKLAKNKEFLNATFSNAIHDKKELMNNYRANVLAGWTALNQITSDKINILKNKSTREEVLGLEFGQQGLADQNNQNTKAQIALEMQKSKNRIAENRDQAQVTASTESGVLPASVNATPYNQYIWGKLGKEQRNKVIAVSTNAPIIKDELDKALKVLEAGGAWARMSATDQKNFVDRVRNTVAGLNQNTVNTGALQKTEWPLVTFSGNYDSPNLIGEIKALRNSVDRTARNLLKQNRIDPGSEDPQFDPNNPLDNIRESYKAR
jgi:hypothetical protein